MVVLVALFAIGMLGVSIQSVIAPFFPAVARAKHIPPLYSSFIFSAGPLAAGLSAPLFGSLVKSLDRKRALVSSILLLVSFMQGSSAFLFASMQQFEG